MSSPSEGLAGSFSLGGSTIAVLSGVDLSWDRSATEWASMGETATSDVLLGVRKFRGSFRKAYVDNTYLTVFTAGTALVGTLYPRGGTTPYISGTIVITGGNLSGIEKDSEAPVIEEGTFIMYSISKS